MIDTPLEQSPPPPGPNDARPSLQQRRIYFEHLSGILLASGFSGDRVGALVAELDGHVALAGTDPVDELGPVGELAEALKQAAGPRRATLTVATVAAGSYALGFALAAAMALTAGADGAVEIPLVVMAQAGTIGAGVMLLRAFGSRSLLGRRTFELARGWPLVAYLVSVVAIVAATTNRTWTVATSTALILAVASAAAALSLLWLLARFQRIEVPGATGHLRRLGWGWLGR